ncbi:MAG: hypothetical protein QME76_12505 [Bacillota bacterium]|nr:hypothetical protein [Bacillota bacterium]
MEERLLIDSMLRSGASDDEIIGKLGCSRPKYMQTKRQLKDLPVWLKLDGYLREGLSVREIASLMGRSISWVSDMANRLGLLPRRRRRRRRVV